jgi:hypothetical protein
LAWKPSREPRYKSWNVFFPRTEKIFGIDEMIFDSMAQQKNRSGCDGGVTESERRGPRLDQISNVSDSNESQIIENARFMHSDETNSNRTNTKSPKYFKSAEARR